MPNSLIAPRWGDRFVDPKTGIPEQRPQRWLDEASRLLNANYADIDERVSNLELLVPVYTEITSADSPYPAGVHEYINCVMDGDITVVLPASGRVFVSRDGSGNTLTIQGTVNGTVDPTLIVDGDSLEVFFVGTEWRI